MLEDANEVQDVLGRQYGMPEIDEDELEAELDALGDDIALDEDTSYLDEISAPNAPTKEPGADSVAVNADGEHEESFMMFMRGVYHTLLMNINGTRYGILY